ncbi:MAG: adenylate/guanylate cyclase domain-containing protein [Opitutus sp.]
MSRASWSTTLRQLWWAPLVCFGGAWALSLTRVAQQQEWKTLDWRTEFRALFQAPPGPRVAIVLFEDDTDTNLVPWPPDRAWHGNFNEFVSLEKAAVIAWDVILDASREGDGDALMAAGTQSAIERGTKVVVAGATSSEPVEMLPGPAGPSIPLTGIEGDTSRIFGDAHALIPFPELRAVAPWGFADAPRASDGIIREVPLLVRFGEEVHPSFALQTLMTYYGVSRDAVRARLGDAIVLQAKEREVRIPITDTGSFLINFRFDQDEWEADFPTYSYRQVLIRINDFHVEKIPGAPEPPDLEGRIVFVGQTVTGKADAGPTPRGAYSPLVLIHANVVHNVITNDYVRRLPEPWVWVGAILIGYTGLILLAHRSVTLLCGGAVLAMVAYLSLCFWGWVWQSVWIPLVTPMIGFAALEFMVIGRRIVQEQRAKQEIKGMFGSYVSPDLVDHMIKSGERPHLGGETVDITAYFSDIQGFSTFSEKLPPERLVELMNEYLTVCTDIVQEERGTLDKYIGDAVVAMFGAPIPVPDHAHRACVAALRVQQALGQLREKWTTEGDKWPAVVAQMRSRIGLNTGRCIVGNMGSRTRFNYTMMGDDVNLAARMESGAKSWGVYAMCTEATKQACEQHGPDSVVFRPLGRIVVKGRAGATPIHEIVAFRKDATDDLLECLSLFTQGLERYLSRDWDGARGLFLRSATLEFHQPGSAGILNNPSLVYLDLVESLRTEAPGPDWDGVFVMKEK